MIAVHGRLVDEETRCVHYNSSLDIIAVRFKCCGRYYACFQCHAEFEDHAPARWPESEFDETAIACGACAAEFAIRDYLASAFVCPSCRSQWNPRCANHYDLYFDMRWEMAHRDGVGADMSRPGPVACLPTAVGQLAQDSQ